MRTVITAQEVSVLDSYHFKGAKRLECEGKPLVISIYLCLSSAAGDILICFYTEYKMYTANLLTKHTSLSRSTGCRDFHNFIISLSAVSNEICKYLFMISESNCLGCNFPVMYFISPQIL